MTASLGGHDLPALLITILRPFTYSEDAFQNTHRFYTAWPRTVTCPFACSFSHGSFIALQGALRLGSSRLEVRSADRSPPEEVSIILMLEIFLEPKEELGMSPWNIQRGASLTC